MKSTVVFCMICDIFFPEQLCNIHFFSIRFVHILPSVLSYSRCKFYFLSSHYSDSQSYQCSPLQPIKTSFLSVGHLIYALLSYYCLNLSHSLVIVHLLLIVGLQEGVIFVGVGLFPEPVVFFRQHLYNSIQDVVGRVILNQPAGGKDPPKNDPTTIKTQPNIQKANINGIKGIPRASSSGDQED